MNLIESAKSLLMESGAYGAWLSTSGKEYPVLGLMKHEPRAIEILGDEWDGTGEASDTLAARGWARLVYKGGRVLVDMDGRLTGSQLRFLKDMSIERRLNVVLDIGPRGEKTLFSSDE